MFDNYAIDSGEKLTVAQLIKILATLPQDYTVTSCGYCQFFINVMENEKAVTIDKCDITGWNDETC